MFFVLVGMLMMGLSGNSLSTGISEHHNHNEDNHDTLCSVLKAAVTLYHSPPSGEKLKKALAQAIFGNQTGGKLEDLKKGLAHEYKTPGSRESSCGSCTYSDRKHYPGWSIPHDLICMCTVGEHGYPFGQNSDDHGNPTLCGRSAADFGCGKNPKDGSGCHENNKHWWTHSSNHDWSGTGQVREHLTATWEKVVKPCLQRRNNGQTKKTLLEKLKVEEQQSPKWARGHTLCNGFSGAVCVNYGHHCGTEHNNNSPQWWKELYEALTTMEDTRAQRNSTRFPRRRTLRKPGGTLTPEEPEDDSEEDEPEETGSTSTSNNNLPLTLLSNQQSGTHLIPPHSWFLTAVLLI
ncbi:Variant surface glycoprotein [Trypanosoma congolense IL3000]|uniref:Variant surface glycoprotein n=1 Tax=Trypanosoma congolense (strain IL3000) TaxID=1068625 RepID=F9WDU8_TRYCI|nr:Variant surface glycoprotein [Trypanosoma congolense IL3000]